MPPVCTVAGLLVHMTINNKWRLLCCSYWAPFCNEYQKSTHVQYCSKNCFSLYCCNWQIAQKQTTCCTAWYRAQFSMTRLNKELKSVTCEHIIKTHSNVCVENPSCTKQTKIRTHIPGTFLKSKATVSIKQFTVLLLILEHKDPLTVASQVSKSFHYYAMCFICPNSMGAGAARQMECQITAEKTQVQIFVQPQNSLGDFQPVILFVWPTSQS